MLIYTGGKPMAFISLAQPPVPVAEVKQDEMECVIYCPYCGSKTTIGQTRMISGYIGCSNCFFAPGGLEDVVVELKTKSYPEYLSGNFYKKGFAMNKQKQTLTRENSDLKKRNDE